MNKRPDRSEAAEYYFTYIDKVPDGDICRILESQSVEIAALLEPIPEAQSDYRYAEDKWSIREVIAHVNGLRAAVCLPRVLVCARIPYAAPELRPERSAEASRCEPPILARSHR